MDLARVVGTVVASQRDPALGPYKLALVQPLDENLKDHGRVVVAIDALNRNVGEIVYLVRSGDAMQAHPGDWLAPTDCAIGGMVDSHFLEGKGVQRP